MPLCHLPRRRRARGLWCIQGWMGWLLASQEQKESCILLLLLVIIYHILSWNQDTDPFRSVTFKYYLLFRGVVNIVLQVMFGTGDILFSWLWLNYELSPSLFFLQCFVLKKLHCDGWADDLLISDDIGLQFWPHICTLWSATQWSQHGSLCISSWLLYCYPV
jgi:hypothetical protein